MFRVLLMAVVVALCSTTSGWAQEFPTLNGDSTNFLTVKQFDEDAQAVLDFHFQRKERMGATIDRDDPDFQIWSGERLYRWYTEPTTSNRAKQILGEPAFKRIP